MKITMLKDYGPLKAGQEVDAASVGFSSSKVKSLVETGYARLVKNKKVGRPKATKKMGSE